MTTETIQLDYFDILFAGIIILGLFILLAYYRLGVTRSLAIASVRLVIQLFLIGYVLRFLFEEGKEGYVSIMAGVMLLVASREILARQKRRLKGWSGFGLGASTLFVSSFAIALYGLFIVVKPEPWYLPQYSIPLLGMIMSNTMSAIGLSMDRLASALHDNRAIIEQRLALGELSRQAIPSLPEGLHSHRDHAGRQFHGHCGHRFPAGHDDRSDLGRSDSHGSREVSNHHLVSNRRRRRFWDGGGPESDRMAAIRRATAPPFGETGLNRV